jgi:hypothetical protein
LDFLGYGSSAHSVKTDYLPTEILHFFLMSCSGVLELHTGEALNGCILEDAIFFILRTFARHKETVKDEMIYEDLIVDELNEYYPDLSNEDLIVYVETAVWLIIAYIRSPQFA